MKSAIAVSLVAALVGCSANRDLSPERVRLASLSFDVPADWQRTDTTRRGVATAEWRPDDNDRKESITVIRSELSPAVAKAGAATVEPYLAAAQRSLSLVRASRVQQVITAQGLSGARVELDFIPAGQKATYRRVHVVLVDGSALVHVLYTAKHADGALAALNLVLNNIHHEEA